ncbi:hypothetical protein [uncultured Flavobacterium sp.]|uniref:hypothetical protein n=1 Tax=uncultured Flavobacterium sp. TaxID=165435 RepID=UPI0030EF86C2|tara:strand:+ start:56066 stop:56239 length:174 start_codon:yes stop_codon:yes gene_type:complete
MKIGPLSIVILLVSFAFMLVTTLDWIDNNPFSDYKILAALQFMLIGRVVLKNQRKKK